MTNSTQINSPPFSFGKLYTQRQAEIQRFNRPSEEMALKVFQLVTDSLYPNSDESLANRTVILHCHKAGGFGDISQTFRCAELIRKHRPFADVRIFIQPEYSSEIEQIEAIFPTKKFDTRFFNTDYREMDKQFSSCIAEGYPLGISVGASVAGPFLRSHPYLRNIREYGFSSHPDTKNNILSMGFAPFEEGILFQEFEPRELVGLQSDWIKGALGIHSPEDQNLYHQTRKLYHMYVSQSWPSQMASLYSVAACEKGSSQPIDILLPTKHTLQEMAEWGVLDLEFLKKCGVGRLIRTTPEGSECIELGSGKDLQLLSGPVPKTDMETIQQHSQPFFGCTGDVSFSEALSLNKLPFYSIEGHKMHFFKSWVAVARGLNLSKMTDFLGLIQKQLEVETEIYKKNTRKKQSWYDPGPSYQLSDPTSVPRLSAKELSPVICQISEQFARLYADRELLQEAVHLNAYLKENHDFSPRLLKMVDRGLIIQNHPQVFERESELWERYKTGEMADEQLAEQFQQLFT